MKGRMRPETGILCVRERTSGGEMNLLGELGMAVAGAYRSVARTRKLLAGLPGQERGTDKAEHTRHALHALVCLGPPTAHARKVPSLHEWRVWRCIDKSTSCDVHIFHRHSLLNQLAPTTSFTVLRPVRQSHGTWIGTAVQQPLHVYTR